MNRSDIYISICVIDRYRCFRIAVFWLRHNFSLSVSE
jgi:hypothetical protein